MPMPEGHDTLPVPSPPNPISYTGLVESLSLVQRTLANQSTDDIVALFTSDPWFSEDGPLMLTVVDTTGYDPDMAVNDGPTRTFTVTRDDVDRERINVRVDISPARPVDPANPLPPTPVPARVDARAIQMAVASLRELLSGHTHDVVMDRLRHPQLTMHGPLGITCWEPGPPRRRYVVAERIRDGRRSRPYARVELLP